MKTLTLTIEWDDPGITEDRLRDELDEALEALRREAASGGGIASGDVDMGWRYNWNPDTGLYADSPWAFAAYSEEHGLETFTGYDTKAEAKAGRCRVKAYAAKLDASVRRFYTKVYQVEG